MYLLTCFVMTGQRCRYESGGKGIENEIRSQIYLISVGGVRFFPAIKMREAMPDDRLFSALLCRISRIESRRSSVLERLDSYAVLSSEGRSCCLPCFAAAECAVKHINQNVLIYKYLFFDCRVLV